MLEASYKRVTYCSVTRDWKDAIVNINNCGLVIIGSYAYQRSYVGHEVMYD